MSIREYLPFTILWLSTRGLKPCLENIWPRVSVPFAVFTITDYLNYEIRGKYGREKQKSLNKFLPAKHQKPSPYRKIVGSQRRANSPALLGTPGRWTGGQEVNRLEVITPEQAKRFRAEAVIAKSAREDQRKQGLHLTKEAFLQRLRTLDPKQFPISSRRNLLCERNFIYGDPI